MVGGLFICGNMMKICLKMFIYDKENRIRNLKGFEKGLTKITNEFIVKVFIRPVILTLLVMIYCRHFKLTLEMYVS